MGNLFANCADARCARTPERNRRAVFGWDRAGAHFQPHHRVAERVWMCVSVCAHRRCHIFQAVHPQFWAHTNTQTHSLHILRDARKTLTFYMFCV